ncbi:hypothetical protein OG900_38535 [Streptomyces sp. NBC_00433]
MGRRESQLDPEAGPVQRFAHDLRLLRQEAGGVAYRAMAESAGYAAATLSEAAAGGRLPSLPVTLAYVGACGGDAAEWERRWWQASRAEAALPAADDGTLAPYRGLARFEPGDQGRFFGRDQLITDLVRLTGQHRFAGLVGTSGSGKSSLLRAGLVPALQGAPPEGRPAVIRILTPGEHPASVHAGALVPVGAESKSDTWVMVDQFEEVFTLCQDTGQRNRFIDLLLTALAPGSRLRVVIAVRADFYGRCSEHRGLADALRAANLLVGPMSPQELREAIVKPAAAGGLILERALTARVITDVVDQPGGLPLMSHALLETWRRRHARTLTLEGYEAAGGVHGSIARTAEEVYTQLSPEQAVLARRLLLRLITPGSGAQDTRRPAARAELTACSPADTTLVLDHLARARLVTLDHDSVDLAHEALITSWPRLHAWIDQNRELLSQQRQLTEAAASWDQLDRDPGALYRGSRLTRAEEAFAAEDREHLTPVERSFLTTSLDTRHREQRTAVHATRRLRTLAAVLTLLLIVAVTTAALALDERRSALTAEQQAQSNADLALDERRSALTAEQQAQSRQVAAQSTALLNTDSDLASLLAVAAYRISPTREALTSLYAAGAVPLQRRLTGHTGGAQSVSFSPDGTAVATAYKNTVRVWDAATGRTKTTLTGLGDNRISVGFRADNRALAATGNRTVKVWDVATRRVLHTLHLDTDVMSMAFSPDGTTLATIGGDGTLLLWDVDTGHTRRSPHATGTTSVAFSPDGRTLATGNDYYGDNTAQLWDTSTGHRRAVLHSPASVTSVAFSPNGRTLATGNDDGTARVWDIATRRNRATLTGYTNGVQSVAFSPDGTILATGSGHGTVQLWPLVGDHAQDAVSGLPAHPGYPIDGRVQATLTGQSGPVTSLAFSPDSRTLATGGADDTVRVWNTTRARAALPVHLSMAAWVAFAPDGRTLATGDRDGVKLWNAAARRIRATLTTDTIKASSVAISPDGTTLAVADQTSSVELWDLTTAHHARTTLNGGSDPTTSVAFSPDGSTLAVGRHDGTVQLWNLATRRAGTTVDGHVGIVESVAFSPDATTLAITGQGRSMDMATNWPLAETRLWNLGGHRTTALLKYPSLITISAAFSPDGHTVATQSSNDDTVRLWDVATGRTRATLKGHTSGVTSVAYSPDGHTLATSSWDGTVRLWDTATGYTRATLTTLSGVTSVAYSPNGRTLATSSWDGTVRLWDATLPDPAGTATQICRAINRDLTAQERSMYLPGPTPNRICPP